MLENVSFDISESLNCSRRFAIDSWVESFLFVFCIMLFAFSFVNHTSFTGKSFAEAYNLPVGQSMFAGDSILDDREMIEVPLISNPSFIIHEISTLDLKGLLLTLTTGYVPFDFPSIVQAAHSI